MGRSLAHTLVLVCIAALISLGFYVARTPSVQDGIRRYVSNYQGHTGGYGKCACCGDHWNWKPYHITNIPNGQKYAGRFVLCQECWTKLTPVQRLKYYSMLVESDMSRGKDTKEGYKSWEEYMLVVTKSVLNEKETDGECSSPR